MMVTSARNETLREYTGAEPGEDERKLVPQVSQNSNDIPKRCVYGQRSAVFDC
jgi:hypothetical protein